MQLGFASKFFTQIFHQRSVYFDAVQFIHTRQKMSRQRAAARSDFNHARIMIAASGYRELFQDRIACEEMLPEPARQPSV